MSQTDAFTWAMESDPRLRSTVVTVIMLDRSPDWDVVRERFEVLSGSLPPGLVINPDTGWFYGYIPDQGATEQTYRFAVRVFKANQPAIISGFYFFTKSLNQLKVNISVT